ncbi:unnamed protein product [Thlaspi arvense]|uniref:HTH myb-type domain-containing protein n=1 Tax=Thlaspi arvense TaxID=13288 RepID=A0AAU9SVL7_THLAR|nr:unnamed protein product [Thlaspi arvense]
MDNINFEFSNALQGNRLHTQPQPPQPFNLQDVNMIHYNQSSPWTTETLSGFTPYDCTANQSFSVQCSSSKPYPSSFHPYHHHQSSDLPSLDQSQSMVPVLPLPDQYLKPFYQRSCANDFAATKASSASYSLSFEASQADPQELCRRTYSNSNVTQLNFSSSSHHQSKQTHPRLSSPPSFSTHGGSMAPNCGNKTRIRWTQDLHEKFVECVNLLGGADKATPKAILKLMESEGLTIFHVKSHLQKYRIAKYIPDSQEGKIDRRSNCGKELSQLDTKTGMQIKEALQLQLDVQRHLHEQLEIQRNLQLRIEEQGKQLKIMIEQQQKTKESLLKSPNAEVSLPLSASINHSPPFSISDADEALTVTSYGHTQFQSKIS